jgi:hypothetical protein
MVAFSFRGRPAHLGIQEFDTHILSRAAEVALESFLDGDPSARSEDLPVRADRSRVRARITS